MDPSEPHWLTNSSFSPPPIRRQVYHFEVDALPHGHDRVPVYGSSLSSHGKRSRSRLTEDQYPNHQHSVSDGALSYHGSPYDNFQASHWIPSVRRFDYGEFSTAVRGARSEICACPESSELCFAVGTSPVSNSIDSASPPSESGQWASTNKSPGLFAHNITNRRSFMSKPVYPLVFRNPISDADTCMAAEPSGGSTSMGVEDKSSPKWSEHTVSSELKFHKALGVLQKLDASPYPSTSTKREGFRCSSASSSNLGFEGDDVEVLENISPLNLRSPNNLVIDEKCGLCGRLLWQRSPWSADRIVRNGDMPIAGILPCQHVFHAECLEETTPKTKIGEPPCPTCLKAVNPEGGTSFSEPLEVALKSARRREAASMEDAQSSRNLSAYNGGGWRRGRSFSVLQERHTSFIKNHLKKHFSWEGRTGKSSFGSKMFAKFSSSSSSLRLRTCRKQAGPSN
ncbi:hypothetical protein Taro_045844 [Colocasia esculenta]|uniref:RING-type domain-containing protein n=1 Tax=Colocasia esculenta TaxID=4460 RepID=A0A843X5D5_COLES|nr:hypothetical protein [Colocasia esculenta]